MNTAVENQNMKPTIIIEDAKIGKFIEIREIK